MGLILVAFSSQDKPRKSGFHFVRSDQLFIRYFSRRSFWRYLLRHGGSGLPKAYHCGGNFEDVEQAKKECGLDHADDLEVVAEVDINQEAVASFADILHRHSTNGVLLGNQAFLFGSIEKVIQACETEGIEVWMLANFFNTQISRTTLDELYGKPVVVFRSTPISTGRSMASRRSISWGRCLPFSFSVRF